MLVEPDSGRALAGKEVVDALVLDLKARASNDFPLAAALAKELECILRSGAQPSALRCTPHSPMAPHFYSQAEADEVLGSFEACKPCLSLPHAAFRSVVVEGGQLSSALVNLRRHVSLTSSH